MRIKPILWGAVLTILLALSAGCSQSPSFPPVTTTQRTHLSPVDRVVLARFLPGLAKAHHDKTQLAFLARFKGLTGPVAKFNSAMADQQGRLLDQLQTWAGRHHISLHYHYPKSVRGAALRVQTKVDGHLLLTASAREFQRMYLVLMYTDFAWQVSLDKSLRKYATNHGLQAYLVNALAINRASVVQISKLLDQYHWTGKP